MSKQPSRGQDSRARTDWNSPKVFAEDKKVVRDESVAGRAKSPAPRSMSRDPPVKRPPAQKQQTSRNPEVQQGQQFQPRDQSRGGEPAVHFEPQMQPCCPPPNIIFTGNPYGAPPYGPPYQLPVQSGGYAGYEADTAGFTSGDFGGGSEPSWGEQVEAQERAQQQMSSSPPARFSMNPEARQFEPAQRPSVAQQQQEQGYASGGEYQTEMVGTRGRGARGGSRGGQFRTGYQEQQQQQDIYPPTQRGGYRGRGFRGQGFRGRGFGRGGGGYRGDDGSGQDRPIPTADDILAARRPRSRTRSASAGQRNRSVSRGRGGDNDDVDDATLGVLEGDIMGSEGVITRAARTEPLARLVPDDVVATWSKADQDEYYARMRVTVQRRKQGRKWRKDVLSQYVNWGDTDPRSVLPVKDVRRISQFYLNGAKNKLKTVKVENEDEVVMKDVPRTPFDLSRAEFTGAQARFSLYDAMNTVHDAAMKEFSDIVKSDNPKQRSIEIEDTVYLRDDGSINMMKLVRVMRLFISQGLVFNAPELPVRTNKLMYQMLCQDTFPNAGPPCIGAMMDLTEAHTTVGPLFSSDLIPIRGLTNGKVRVPITAYCHVDEEQRPRPEAIAVGWNRGRLSGVRREMIEVLDDAVPAFELFYTEADAVSDSQKALVYAPDSAKVVANKTFRTVDGLVKHLKNAGEQRKEQKYTDQRRKKCLATFEAYFNVTKDMRGHPSKMGLLPLETLHDEATGLRNSVHWTREVQAVYDALLDHVEASVERRAIISSWKRLYALYKDVNVMLPENLRFIDNRTLRARYLQLQPFMVDKDAAYNKGLPDDAEPRHTDVNVVYDTTLDEFRKIAEKAPGDQTEQLRGLVPSIEKEVRRLTAPTEELRRQQPKAQTDMTAKQIRKVLRNELRRYYTDELGIEKTEAAKLLSAKEEDALLTEIFGTDFIAYAKDHSADGKSRMNRLVDIFGIGLLSIVKPEERLQLFLDWDDQDKMRSMYEVFDYRRARTEQETADRAQPKPPRQQRQPKQEQKVKQMVKKIEEEPQAPLAAEDSPPPPADNDG